jgi:glycosyltransferase involved in cell wall biosynthesis
MRISVVIPTFSRIKCVGDLLRDLSSQTDVEMECIVVLQGRDDLNQVEALIRPFPGRMRVFFLAKPSASLARNIGLVEAAGEIVLFLDDDVRIRDRRFLQKHLANFSDEKISGVYGQVLEVGQVPTAYPDVSKIESDYGWMFLPANYSRRCRTRNGGSGNLSVRREWALAVGGMDAWFERGAIREETEFNLRYTKRFGSLIFDPDASLLHLSASGGSRTWGHVRRTVPMHHIMGRWYFLLSALRDRTLGLRGVVLELRSIAVFLLINPRTGYDFLGFGRNAGRAFFGLAVAVGSILRGPRRVESLRSSLYELVAVSARDPSIPVPK